MWTKPIVKDRCGHDTATHAKDIPRLCFCMTTQRGTICACSNMRNSDLCLLSSSLEERHQNEGRWMRDSPFCHSTSKYLISTCWKDRLHTLWEQWAAPRGGTTPSKTVFHICLLDYGHFGTTISFAFMFACKVPIWPLTAVRNTCIQTSSINSLTHCCYFCFEFYTANY